MNDASNADLLMLSTLIQERTGLIYEPIRLDLLADKLSPLMAEGNFDRYMDYYYFLKYDEAAGQEWQRVQSALAVNETYFWREFDQIRVVAEKIVPELQRERPHQPVRIWHAASASGEEPYTMAIALTEAGCYERGPIEISATDFNPSALAHARLGIYRPRSFRSLPESILLRYFLAQPNGQHRVVDAIRARVNFSYLNLVDAQGLQRFQSYDIIICRNVFIYFSEPAIRQVSNGFYQALSPQGYLFVAAAESLLRYTNLFELIEVGNAFAYRKRSTPTSQILNEPYQPQR